jgi:uncharacterized protein YndB with AHSA1/START domain
VSSWRQQALIPAPVERVWELVGNPNRYPEWAADVVQVTGLPSVVPKATYRQVTKSPVGSRDTTFVVDAVAELREIRLRCVDRGYYARWLLTPARGQTFAEVEIGMEPTSFGGRAVDRAIGKRWYRGVAAQYLDGVRHEVGGRS